MFQNISTSISCSTTTTTHSINHDSLPASSPIDHTESATNTLSIQQRKVIQLLAAINQTEKDLDEINKQIQEIDKQKEWKKRFELIKTRDAINNEKQRLEFIKGLYSMPPEINVTIFSHIDFKEIKIIQSKDTSCLFEGLSFFEQLDKLKNGLVNNEELNGSLVFRVKDAIVKLIEHKMFEHRNNTPYWNDVSNNCVNFLGLGLAAAEKTMPELLGDHSTILYPIFENMLSILSGKVSSMNLIIDWDANLPDTNINYHPGIKLLHQTCLLIAYFKAKDGQFHLSSTDLEAFLCRLLNAFSINENTSNAILGNKIEYIAGPYLLDHGIPMLDLPKIETNPNDSVWFLDEPQAVSWSWNFPYCYGLAGKYEKCLTEIQKKPHAINHVINGFIYGNHTDLLEHLFRDPTVNLLAINKSKLQEIVEMSEGKFFSRIVSNNPHPDLNDIYIEIGRMVEKGEININSIKKNPEVIDTIISGYITNHRTFKIQAFIENPILDLSVIQSSTFEKIFSIKNINAQYPLPCLYALAGRMNDCLTLAIENPACIDDIITGLTRFSNNNEFSRKFLNNPGIDLSFISQPTSEILFKLFLKENINIQYPLPCLYALAGRMNDCLTLAIKNPACINDIVTGLTHHFNKDKLLKQFLSNPDIDLSFLNQPTSETLRKIFRITETKYLLIRLYSKLERYEDCFKQIKSDPLSISECIQEIINNSQYTPTNQEIKDLFSQILNDTDIDLSLIDPSTCKAMIKQLGERTCIDILLNCSHPNLTYIYGLLGLSKECLNAIENNAQSINAVIQGIIAGNHETLFFNIFANPNIDLSQIHFPIQETILKQFSIIEAPYHEICLHAVLGRYEYCVNQAKENPACIKDILISFINSNRKDCLINFLEEPTIDFSYMDVSIQEKVLLKLSNNPNSRQAQFLISFIKRYNTFFDIGLSSIKILTEESQSSNDQVFINAFFKQYRYCIEKTAIDSSLIQDTIMGFLAGKHLKLLEKFLIDIDNNFSCIHSSTWNTLAAVTNLDYTMIIGKCVRNYPDQALQLIENLPIIILEKIDIQQFFEKYISRISSELKTHPILQSIASRFLSSKKLDLAEKYAQLIPDTPANEDLMRKKLELLETIQDNIPDSWETDINE